MFRVPRLQLQPLLAESSLTYSHLSHSVSSHLDSSPESSEAGADVLLSRTGETRMSAGAAPEERKVKPCLHRATADLEGASEHRRQSSPAAFQSPGGGGSAAGPAPLPTGPQEAEEHSLSERSTPQGSAPAAPRAQARHLRRQPVQQHRRGAQPAGHLDPASPPPAHHQEPDAPRKRL